MKTVLPSLLLAFALTALPAFAPATPQASSHLMACGVPEGVAWDEPPDGPGALPAAHPRPIRIVVLGSSSTAGAGATGTANSYPERLTAALQHRFGARRVTVFNAGVGGETTAQMAARIDRDVLSRSPTLVIWQAGVNDAIRGVGISTFRRTLLDGVRRLRARGIDVVLLDQQDFPGAAAIKEYSGYVEVMSDIARQEQIAVLRRFRIMRFLAGRENRGLRGLLAADAFHMNDLTHRCIGELLAAGLEKHWH